jgi:hypothetical protein
MQRGANEYLLKPVSTKALFDRLVSVLAYPRPMVRNGSYYGPRPRKGGAGTSNTEAEGIYADVFGADRAGETVNAAVAGGDRQAPDGPEKIEEKDDIIFI